jgi:small subunit ribosomal protein S7
MSRTKTITKKQKEVDSVYKSRVVTRLIDVVMRHGQRAKAEKLVYSSLSKLSEDRKEATAQFENAIKNVLPKIEVRSRRIGGATYQVPTPLRHDRSEALALRWLVDASRNKHGKPFDEKLSQELKDAANNTGTAVKKRDDMHRMAEANKAFAHFKW